MLLESHVLIAGNHPLGGGSCRLGWEGETCVTRSNEAMKKFVVQIGFGFFLGLAEIVGNHPLGGGFGLGCGGGNLELRFRTGVRRGKPS
jgi:hypothetical protein